MHKCDFIEVTVRHGCSPVNLLHISRTLFPKNTSGRLLLSGMDVFIKFCKKLITAVFMSTSDPVSLFMTQFISYHQDY